MNVKERRADFAAGTAAALAQQLGGELATFVAPGRLSTRFVFLADDDRLVVLCGDQERQRDVDRALAFGLAWAGDRDLQLVLPHAAVGPSITRASFLRPHIRVFGHDGTTVDEIAPVTRGEVLSAIDDDLELSAHDLGDRGSWVERLVEWCASHRDLRDARRPAYRAWHCDGRMVVRIRRTADGLEVSCGVHATVPSERYVPLVTRTITADLDDTQFAELTAAAQRAVDDRLDGTDASHREHLLQARLGDDPNSLGLDRVWREMPCVRPGGDRNYIDLLGVDPAGRIHVVETKIGGDEMLVLQGLDYLLWTLAHRDALAAALEARADLEPVVDFVVAGTSSTANAIGPYTAAQAEALHGSIRWRFHIADGWQAGDLTISGCQSRSMPDPPIARRRVAPRRFADRLNDELIARNGPLARDGVSMVSIDNHISAASRPIWDQLSAAGRLHRWARHVRSSQAFAINLFGSLAPSAHARLLSDVFEQPITAPSIEFEFEDPDDRLGEATPARPHRTQVDVVLRGERSSGSTVALLIEVKLSEDDFGHCSAFESERNDTRQVCRTSGAFGGDPHRCFQLRNHDTGPRRNYDQYLPPPPTQPPTPPACGCWYRTSASQPMRNLALAGVLAADGDTDARFALTALRDHHTIWRRWAEARRVLDTARMIDLPAERVLSYIEPAEREWLRSKYPLTEAGTNR